MNYTADKKKLPFEIKRDEAMKRGNKMSGKFGNIEWVKAVGLS